MRRSDARPRTCFGADGGAFGFGCDLVSGTKASARSCAGMSLRRGSACNLPSTSSGGACSSSKRLAAVLAMSCFPFELRRAAGSGEIRLHLRQHTVEGLPVGLADVRERLGAGEVANLLHGGDQLVGGGLQKE